MTGGVRGMSGRSDGTTMGYCWQGCGARVRGRFVRSVDTGGSGAGGYDVVDGGAYGHACAGPTGEPTRRYPNPGAHR